MYSGLVYQTIHGLGAAIYANYLWLSCNGVCLRTEGTAREAREQSGLPRISGGGSLVSSWLIMDLQRGTLRLGIWPNRLWVLPYTTTCSNLRRAALQSVTPKSSSKQNTHLSQAILLYRFSWSRTKIMARLQHIQGAVKSSTRPSLHRKHERSIACPTGAGKMGGTSCSRVTRSALCVKRILLLALGCCIFPQHRLHRFNGFWSCMQTLIQSHVLLEDVDGMVTQFWWWWIARVVDQWQQGLVAGVVDQRSRRLIARVVRRMRGYDQLCTFAELSGLIHPVQILVKAHVSHVDTEHWFVGCHAPLLRGGRFGSSKHRRGNPIRGRGTTIRVAGPFHHLNLGGLCYGSAAWARVEWVIWSSGPRWPLCQFVVWLLGHTQGGTSNAILMIKSEGWARDGSLRFLVAIWSWRPIGIYTLIQLEGVEWGTRGRVGGRA